MEYKKLVVFNTLTSQFEEVAVSEAVYNEYRRGKWRIKRNTRKKRSNEILFSNLVGGEDGNYENFSEFLSENENPEMLLCAAEDSILLYRAIESLPEREKQIINMFYFRQMSSKEIGERLGVTEQTVTKRRRSAFRRIKKFFEKI